MHSCDNGDVSNRFDNHFSGSASVHKYETILCKHHFPRMKTSPGQLSPKNNGGKILSDLPENLKFSRFTHLKNNTKKSSFLAKIPVVFRFIFL